ncbi:MAG: hypothetical protein OHK0015_08410 [Chloroflexi bacterium OHK40]
MTLPPDHQAAPRPERARLWRSNPPLAAGGAIVALLIVVAIAGPLVAPHGPLERTLVAEIGGRTRGVPFPPFQSWEFPLGSDRFGRDLLSRLLWAVRPTLLLVTIVALLRLALGLLIGTVAGSSRLPGRALSALTDAALAVPVLVVALAAITAVGIERGLVAFIVGMCLTGWAETAQIVRAQTQLVAARPFVQAAHALGANGPQILIRHIGRHLAPLLGTLLAFEISAGLLLAGSLGFLGYFIGGGVWIITDGMAIPQAERVAGLPELGQLIGSAEVRISSRPPWEMIFPGLLIVAAILGFALLGEGLRRYTTMAPPRPSRLTSAVAAIEEATVVRAGAWDGLTARTGSAIIVALVGAAALLWWPYRSSSERESPQPATAFATPNGWSAERGDPYGTLRAPVPPSAPALRWQFADPSGLAGGPAIAPDGTVYVGGISGRLHALAPDGSTRWSAPIQAEPVGAPALAPDGTIYMADRRGGLSAFTPAGEPRWRFQSSYRHEATSGPIVGPDGTIYYALIDAVQAVSPTGEGRWVGRDPELPYLEVSPRLSPDGAMVFLKGSAFSTEDGSQLPLPIVPDEPAFAEPVLLVGADGRTYYSSEHRLVPWRRVDAGVAVQQALGWPARNTFSMPSDVGVTRAGTAWMLYSTEFADTRVVWIGGDGQQIGEFFAPMRASRAIAVADDGTLQVCGAARSRGLSCAAFSPAAGEEPLWEVAIGAPGALARGGAIVDGRTYLVTDDGHLYALE